MSASGQNTPPAGMGSAGNFNSAVGNAIGSPSLAVIAGTAVSGTTGNGATATGGKSWLDRLKRRGKGKIAPIERIFLNAKIALEYCPALQGLINYNAHELCVMFTRCPPWETASATWQPRRWEDQDDRLFCAWLQNNGIFVSSDTAADAAETVARTKPFYPLQDYLNNLVWDGKERIDTWLTTYLGADDTPYTRAVGPRWLISAVARAMSPGVKADCMLILEGRQGLNKSTALETLCGAQYFLDDIKDLGDKDTKIGLAGRWIIEFSELEGFRGASLERLKAFISRKVDRYRPLYGRHVTANDRQFVFAGTTNKSVYLEDPTGNRRFWPVACHDIKVDLIAAERDQLWAEALVAFKAGRPHWLEADDVQELAAAEQDQRYEADPWEEPIVDYLANHLKQDAVSTMTLLKKASEKRVKDFNRGDQMRIGTIMQHLGWKRVQVRDGSKRLWLYKRPDNWVAPKSFAEKFAAADLND